MIFNSVISKGHVFHIDININVMMKMPQVAIM